MTPDNLPYVGQVDVGFDDSNGPAAKVCGTPSSACVCVCVCVCVLVCVYAFARSYLLHRARLPRRQSAALLLARGEVGG